MRKCVVSNLPESSNWSHEITTLMANVNDGNICVPCIIYTLLLIIFEQEYGRRFIRKPFSHNRSHSEISRIILNSPQYVNSRSKISVPILWKGSTGKKTYLSPHFFLMIINWCCLITPYHYSNETCGNSKVLF